MTPLRIGIVEDDDRLRAEFVQLIDGTGDMGCVGAYASAEAALAELPSQTPDVVLMDINLPGMSGIESVGQLRRADADRTSHDGHVVRRHHVGVRVAQGGRQRLHPQAGAGRRAAGRDSRPRRRRRTDERRRSRGRSSSSSASTDRRRKCRR